ncbi:GntR family transcriptional regulator [Kitasatospora sp. NPDC058965]|uniref:GntR family transcriptional regulator n=1 Tax=Kitasatospora sp. NPDC058965 TaxID=3346682 RepID=UPI003689D1A3
MHEDQPQQGSQSSIRSLKFVQDRLSLQVARALRAAVVSGELRPGVVYSAPTLAADFGVSATPVREAMLVLAREGLVEIVRNKGFRVVEDTERDLAEWSEVRALLEGPMVARLTGTATPAQLTALRPLAERTVAAAAAGDLAGYLAADGEFHQALMALAGNTRLVETVAELGNRTRLHGPAGLDRAGDLRPVAEQHLELLDLMLAGDAAGARRCLDRHLGQPAD